jgi:DNA-binding winged helix-turn-helix (wHTH) protein/tetratricopeptide (TPR) repeat protein
MPNKTRHLYEFGPFRLDPDHRLLLRENQPVPLQPKAFDILLVLIEKSEKVVLKDDLLKAVWPDTFVEESNLAQNIFVLRKTLGASGGDRRYIVTHPGRGYSFVEKVMVVPDGVAEGAGQEEESLVVESHTRSRLVIEERSGPVLALPAKSRKLRWVLVSVAAATTIVLMAYFLLGRKPRIAEKDMIVLADFANQTDDPVFDDTLKTALGIALEQSPFLNTLSDNRVRRMLRLMARPADTKITRDVAREICQRAGGKAYIAGSIAQLGTQYVLTLEALNCQSGDTMAERQVPAASKEKVLDALGGAATQLRSALGESLATVQKFDAALPQATTSSLEALKAYSLGEKFFYRRDLASAPAYFQRALELDPNFAMAYVQLGLSYYSLGQPGRAREYFAKAISLQQRTSEIEKMKINGLYYAYATGELDKAIHALQQQVEIYKVSPAYNALSDLYTRIGQYENSADAAHKLLSLDPSDQFGYGSLALDDLALQNFNGTRQVVQEAQARAVDNYFLRMYLYTVAFLQADAGGMTEQQQWFASHSDYENYGLALTADTEAYFGHLNKARELTRLAAESAVRADNKENAAMYRANGALREAAYGNAVEAKQSAAQALELSPGSPGVAVQVALAFAMTGERTRAVSLVQELNKRFPLETQLQSLGLPAIEAQLQLAQRSPDLALNTLRAGLPIEFANAIFSTNNTSCLYPTYIRGQAYLAAGQGSAAAAEFQKIMDHSGIVWNCWTGVLAHLGLARANALQARSSHGVDANAAGARARAGYEDFLAMWKDADSNIPVYKQARVEYANLK